METVPSITTHCLLLLIAFGSIARVTTAQDALLSESPTTENSSQVIPRSELTIVGNGDKREMQLRGRFVDVEGNPVENVRLSAWLKKSPGRTELSPVIKGSEFQVLLPIGYTGWTHLELSATTADNARRAFKGLPNWRYRAAALNGVDLVLKDADRDVAVTVKYNGQPVANAHVVAESNGSAVLKATTDADGVAKLQLFASERLDQLTAWTDDFEIGGYSFHREPQRDPLGTEFTVELDSCRDQRIRVVDANDGGPISELSFALTIGTGKPNYNFPGTATTLPQATLTTDKQGETSYPWFPDWEKHGSYIEFTSPLWARVGKLQANDDGVLVQMVKPRNVRKPLLGQVVSPTLDVSGLLVQVGTFQDEEESRSDHQYGFTDRNGRFALDCIAGATYCVYVCDENIVSNTIDLIPFDLKTGKSNLSTLEISEGAEVEILVTQGPDKDPVKNQWINVRSNHSFQWEEDGETKHGMGGRGWGVTTDEKGVAVATAFPGTEFTATVYMGEWRSGDKKLIINEDGKNRLTIHREIAEEREIRGQLTLSDGVDADLAQAELEVCGVDGETDGQASFVADKAGQFLVKSKAKEYGIFACTKDRKAAGAISRFDDGPVEVVLSPTMDFQGQLLTPSDRPVVGHRVWAYVYVKGTTRWDFETMDHDTKFVARKLEATTDNEGRYTIKNVPTNLELRVYAEKQPGKADEEMFRLGTTQLQVGKPQPEQVDKVRVRDTADF